MSKNKDSQPTKMKRTGDTSFVVEHDDGSKFEGTIDPSKVRFAEDSRKTASRFHFLHFPGKVRPRNVMSNEDRRKLGLPEDPDLEK